MELDFNKIIRLKKIRIEKSELSEEENALTAPILKDKSLIHEIYKIFVELLNERGCPPNIDSVTQRKKFIFIILYLFSPSSLAGGKMTAGLREEMSRVRGLVLRLLLCVHGVKSNKYVISFFIFACFIVTNMLLL